MIGRDRAIEREIQEPPSECDKCVKELREKLKKCPVCKNDGEVNGDMCPHCMGLGWPHVWQEC